MKWLREDQSLVFGGEKEGLKELHHEKKTIEVAWEKSAHEVDRRITNALKRDIIRTLADDVDVNFKERDSRKDVKVGPHSCRVYEMQNFHTTILRRYVKANATKLPVGTRVKQMDHSLGDDLSKFKYSDYLKEESDGDKALLYAEEKISSKDRTFKGTWYICKTFPRTIQDLMPIFEVLSPTHKHFRNLSSFVSVKLPNDGFPVKVQIPVFPTITATASFLHYSEDEIPDKTFDIPKNYKFVKKSSFKDLSAALKIDEPERKDSKSKKKATS
mmetsp:Transcript_27948/g.31073  ORF Transcript_27948/g.31073 Transcript_27948/m.31073 type:complete len:272 (-) Transcript_27948:89-904(-)